MHKPIEVSTKYLPLYTTKKPIILITGGRGSAKSFETSLFTKRLSYEANQVILYSRYTLEAAHLSIIPELTEKMELEGDANNFKAVKNDILNTYSGSSIHFRGIKTSSGNQTAKLKAIQGLSTFIVDEAEEWQSEDDYDTIKLSVRTKAAKNRIVIVMNPTSSDHFIYEKYIAGSHKIVNIDGVDVQISTHKDVEHIHTTYLDAKQYLSDTFLNDASDIKKNNPYKYAHKVIGRWADKAEGVIFDNWTEGEFKDTDLMGWGMDWGYSIDPTTLVRVSIDVDNKKIYLKEHLYQTGMSQEQITYHLEQTINNKNDVIVGDSSEPRMIDAIHDKGFNILGAKKGAGSIKTGIRQLLDFKIIADPDSNNLKKELNLYAWSNKKGEIPIDAHNHIIDGVRYIVDELLASNGGFYFG